MVLIECGSPFQVRPSYVRFGDFRRVMWGWFAITTYPHGINEMIEGIGHAGAELYKAGELDDEPEGISVTLTPPRS